MATTALSPQLLLAREISNFYADPYGFVLFSHFPWGEPGALEATKPPDANQKEFLQSLGAEVLKREFDGAEPRSCRFACASLPKATAPASRRWWAHGLHGGFSARGHSRSVP